MGGKRKVDEEQADLISLRYIGDGERYVIGRPASPDAVEVVDPETAAGLVDSGLYEVVGSTPAAPEGGSDS